jgi:hypothetical protein
VAVVEVAGGAVEVGVLALVDVEAGDVLVGEDAEPSRLMIALYAGLGLKLASKRSGLLLERHESLSLTPQLVIPTQLLTARQAFTTLR